MLKLNPEKINYDSYNLAIIDIAFKNYYIDNISVEDTIDKLLLDHNLAPFQLVCKKSKKFDSLAQFDISTNEYIPLPNKVYRVFATTLKSKGMIYKLKNGKYDKYTNTPDYTYIHNDNLLRMNPDIIDREWYINLCTKYLLENQTVKNKLKLNNSNQMLLFEL